ELIGEKHRDTVGTRVVIETAGGAQTKYVKGGGSYGSTSDRRMVFWIGADAEVKRATVYWPSGKSQEIANLKPGSYWQITENEKDARKVEPRKP
ncbi:MAG TPA: ASPIC/UnbV domain-containing protein, partial [Gemmata sp.]|nr:ASPIC/UnbV domain-containing protein [Gemmata sp.]